MSNMSKISAAFEGNTSFTAPPTNRRHENFIKLRNLGHAILLNVVALKNSERAPHSLTEAIKRAVMQASLAELQDEFSKSPASNSFSLGDVNSQSPSCLTSTDTTSALGSVDPNAASLAPSVNNNHALPQTAAPNANGNQTSIGVSNGVQATAATSEVHWIDDIQFPVRWIEESKMFVSLSDEEIEAESSGGEPEPDAGDSDEEDDEPELFYDYQAGNNYLKHAAQCYYELPLGAVLLRVPTDLPINA